MKVKKKGEAQPSELFGCTKKRRLYSFQVSTMVPPRNGLTDGKPGGPRIYWRLQMTRDDRTALGLDSINAARTLNVASEFPELESNCV